MKALRLVFLACVIPCLAGCDSLSGAFPEDVAIETSPPNAAVTLSNGETCVAPCTVKVDRTASPSIRAAKPGCEDAVQTIQSNVPEGGTIALGFIDFGTGRAAEHQPNPTAIKLICSERKPVEMSPFDDATIALLHGGQLEDATLPPFDENAFQREHHRLFPRNQPSQ